MKLRIILLSLAAISFTACLKEECFDPNGRKDNYIIKDIPSDFNWSMTQNVTITVTPDDETYTHYYIAEIYNAHPTLGQNPVLYAKGVCKGNQPFTQEITVPEAIKHLYVRLTTPIGEEIVAMVEVEKNIVCDFAPAEAFEEPSLTSRSISLTQQNSVSFDVPENATSINGSNATIKKNTVYVLNGEYNGNITLPGEGNFSLYIKGTWNCDAENLDIENGGKIYVLNGGQLNFTKKCTVDFINSSFLYIEKGGKVKGDDMFLRFTNSTSSIINYGEVNIKDLEYQSGAKLYNYGSYNVKSFIVDNNSTKFQNKGDFSADLFSFIGCTVDNDSNMVVKILKGEQGTLTNNISIAADSLAIERTTIYNNCYIVNKNGAHFVQVKYSGAEMGQFETKSCDMTGSTIDLWNLNQFIVDETLFINGETSKIMGKGNGYSLLSANKIILKGWGAVEYKGNLEIECNDYTQNEPYMLYYSAQNKVHFVSETTLEIPECKCNSGRYKTPENPVDPEFPYTQVSNLNYTWVSEDNYPNLGDYDMNDMVMRIKKQTLIKNDQNLVKEMKIDMTLVALGATKRIGAAVQLDQIAIGNIESAQMKGVEFDGDMFTVNGNGLETKQSLPVIPIFDNGHRVLGYSSTIEIINTIDHAKGNLAEEVDMTLDIKFTTPVNTENLNIDKLNFFIIAGNDFTPTRPEVHIPGYNTTDLSKIPDLVQDAASGLMWGLMIPTEYKYPTESIKILDAYPDFETWVTSNKTEHLDWYNNPSTTDGYVYIW